MVLARAGRAVPSLVVPDELALTVWGHDPYARGLAPVSARGAARALLSAEPLPVALRGVLVELEAALPRGAFSQTVPIPWPAVVACDHAAAGASPGDEDDVSHHPSAHSEGDEQQSDAQHGHTEAHEGETDDHGAHDGHDHEDMMAISGEPSADGLVMEPIELSYGPLLTPLPGGLVLDVELDGDVVSRCTALPILHVQQPSGVALVPDPLAPAAWTAVLEAAAESRTGVIPTDAWRWRRVAAVELERAVSHLAWLRSFARLLGWTLLVERVQPALDALVKSRAETPPALAPLALATPAAEEIIALLTRHGVWTARTQGRGLLEGDVSAGLYGPNSRAAGVARDARIDDSLFVELGFEPVLEPEADARARTLVRAREAAQSIGLAAVALRRAASSAERSHTASPAWWGMSVVEGPRGPLTARVTGDGLTLAAPGERAAIGAAGRAAIGCEWASALVGVASLDLSPWRVGA